MFLSVLKIVAFTALVLLLGQIPVKGKTIAGHLEGQVLHSLQRAKHELKQTKLFANLSQVPKLGDVLRGMAAIPEKTDVKIGGKNTPKTLAKTITKAMTAVKIKRLEPKPEPKGEATHKPLEQKLETITKATTSEKITQSDRLSLQRLLQ